MLRKAAVAVLTKPRSVFTTLLEVAGLGVIAAGIWQINPVAGLIAAGSALILIGVLAA